MWYFFPTIYHIKFCKNLINSPSRNKTKIYTCLICSSRNLSRIIFTTSSNHKLIVEITLTLSLSYQQFLKNQNQTSDIFYSKLSHNNRFHIFENIGNHYRIAYAVATAKSIGKNAFRTELNYSGPRRSNVKESDNFAHYFNSRWCTFESVFRPVDQGGKYCSMHSARRQDTQRSRNHPRRYLVAASVYVLASAYIISRDSWRACCA